MLEVLAIQAQNRFNELESIKKREKIANPIVKKVKQFFFCSLAILKLRGRLHTQVFLLI